MQPFGGNVSLPRVDKTKLELSVWSTTKTLTAAFFAARAATHECWMKLVS